MASEDLSRVTELVVSPVTLSHFTLLVYLTSISDHLSASPPLHDILHTIVSLKLCFHLVWLIQSSTQSLWVWTVKTTKCLVAAPLKCITLLWLYCFIDLDLCVFLLSVYTLGNGENTNVHLQKVVFFLSSLLSSYFLFFFCQTTWLMVSNYTEGKIDRVTIIVLKWRVAVALVNVVQENKTFPWAALPRGTWERMLWCLLLVCRHVANKDDSDSANKRNVCYFMEYGGSWRGKEEILR